MDMNLGVGLGANTPASVRRIPNFTGTNYGTLDTPIVFTGDFEVEVEYSSVETDLLNAAILGDSVSAGAVNYLQLEQTGGYVKFLTLDGSVSWLHNNEHRDGKIHIIKPYREGNTIGIKLDGDVKSSTVFASASPVTIDLVGCLGIAGVQSQLFKGQILSTKFTDKSGAEDVVTNYVFDSGSTVEQFARGSDTLKVTFTSVTAANWSRYTLQRNIVHKLGVVAEGWLGDDIVVNGRFDADTDWAKGIGWSVTSGVASGSAGTASGILQNAGTLSGDIYLAKIEVSNYSAGSVASYVGSQIGTNLIANGKYAEIITDGGTITDTGAWKDLTFAGDIDNVSVQHLLEVTQ